MAKEQLELQLSELELLGGMYPGPGELVMADHYMLEDMQRFLDGDRQDTPRNLQFTVRLTMESKPATLHVQCSLPLAYPEVAPSVYAYSDSLSRQAQTALNEALENFMKTMDLGDLCMSSILLWLQEHAAPYIDVGVEEQAQGGRTRNKCKYSALSRLWIYSHHIYRKELLKKIPESASEFGLTGFVLPGKPGLICVEGYKECCDEYWQRLKYPNWKHISCKHREDLPLDSESPHNEQLQRFQLFSDFQELAFEAHGDYGLRNDYHMDLGEFLKFLKDHQCEYMFNVFFGLAGKESGKDKN